MPKIKRAILSVTNKVGIVELGKFLSSQNVEILSTGGTSKVLREAGVPVKDVSEYTGSPEVMDGRLKTIHPKIEGGILGVRSNPSHIKDMESLGILPIDLVVVNLYEFQKAASKVDILLSQDDSVPLEMWEELVEQIDIGGPTMLRAAAKNYHDVTVVVDPNDYPAIISEIQKSGEVSSATNARLALKVFQTTAAYDSIIASYLGLRFDPPQPFPENLRLSFKKVQSLRYGENPHQVASFYQETNPPKASVVNAKQVHGKELSFNNIIDLEAAYLAVRDFKDPACVIIKHTNPCGASLGQNLCEAFLKAKESDPVSAFGGIVGFNQEVDLKTANALAETFFECIIAPAFEPKALEVLQQKKNIRLMVLKDFFPGDRAGEQDYKRVSGGLLVQSSDTGQVDLKKCQVLTKRKPTEQEYAELDFAWKLIKHIKSNAILFTKNRQVLGVGAGQMSRVDSVYIASRKAASRGTAKSLKGAVMASDAFFPFRDGLDEAAKTGITAVVQPGGSVKDAEVIAAADEHGLAMIFTGMRHFKH